MNTTTIIKIDVLIFNNKEDDTINQLNHENFQKYLRELQRGKMLPKLSRLRSFAW